MSPTIPDVARTQTKQVTAVMLARERIAASPINKRRSIVFVGWCQRAPGFNTLLVRPTLVCLPVISAIVAKHTCATNTHADRETDRPRNAKTCVGIGRVYACDAAYEKQVQIKFNKFSRLTRKTLSLKLAKCCSVLK